MVGRLESDMVTVLHDSDCAVHNEPALPKGDCDCGADALARLSHTPGPWRMHQVEPRTIVAVDRNGHGAEVANTLNSLSSPEQADADARLIANALNTITALDSLVMLFGRTGNALEDFEEQAAAFQRDTGFMRPGKDMAAASGGEADREVRHTRFNAWVQSKIEAAREALAEVGAP